MTRLFISLCACVFLISGCGGDKSSTENDTSESAPNNAETETATTGDDALQPEIIEDAEPAAPQKLEPSIEVAADDPAYADLPKVRMETSYGPITVALFPEKAPNTVANFVQYVEARHYNRTIFHRVIPGFMIQGGGFSTFVEERATREPIAYEGDNGLSNERGTLAMARRNDPNSATAQWYINHEDNRNLDHGARGANVAGYTVFGRVMSGMNVVDAIAGVENAYRLCW